MDRRVAGVLVLVVALLATMVLPNVAGRELIGSAVAELISSPPPVGACVGGVGDILPGSVAIAPTGAPEYPADRALSVATIVPCAGTVAGEVISVSAQNTRQISTLQEYDDAHPSCRDQVETYLGTRATTDLFAVRWTKSIYVNAVTVGPDAHDRAAGRTWTACVLGAVGQTYAAPPSLKSSWASHRLPNAFGLCWADLIMQHGVPTPCTSAHTTQQLALGLVRAPSATATSIVSAADPADVNAGCRLVAAMIMNVDDATFGGALTITVVSDPGVAPFVQCAAGATGGRTLVGSLIGLGTRPLPLA